MSRDPNLMPEPAPGWCLIARCENPFPRPTRLGAIELLPEVEDSRSCWWGKVMRETTQGTVKVGQILLYRHAQCDSVILRGLVYHLARLDMIAMTTPLGSVDAPFNQATDEKISAHFQQLRSPIATANGG